MLLDHRLLTTDAELERFSRLYALKSHGIPATVAFLKQGDVRVFFYEDATDEWIAGYTVSTTPPCRYLEVHTPEVRAELLARHGLAETDIVEIGAIWMDPRALLRDGRPMSQRYRWEIYQHMMGDAFAARRPIIMGGTVSPAIRAFQMQVTKRAFFDGEVTIGGKPQHIWQYYTYRHDLWRDFFRATLREFGLEPGGGGTPMAIAA